MAIVRRFGGAPGLNVHIHALVLHGAIAREENVQLRCHLLPGQTTADVGGALAAIEPDVARLLARRGVRDERDRA